MPRVVSFLPAGTEIAFAIGAGPSVVGRSHECDYPPEVRSLPVVSRPALRLDQLSHDEIDAAVAEQLRNSGTLYEVDEALLRQLAPDVILTQDLCQVCAPSGNELTRAVAELPSKPAVVWLTPRNVEQIHENVLAVGRVTGRQVEAERLVIETRARLRAVHEHVAHRRPRRVVFLEWVEPFFSAGHWVPEMISMAGGEDPLGRGGEDSRRITFDEIKHARPELIVVAPCGYGLERSRELALTLSPAGGAAVWAVDANAYFARPGPRLAEGVELLARIFHCELCGPPHRNRAVRVA
jgi:iron complex transport system substrate-binding protein